MKILFAGSNGMIGSAVTRHLIESGHKLLAAGYRFRFPELEQALRHEMGSMNAGLATNASK